MAKRYGGTVTNTRQYERTMLLEVLGYNMAPLEQDHVFARCCRLERRCRASKKMITFLEQNVDAQIESAYTCAQVRLASEAVCTKGDIVLLTESCEAAEVWLHVECNGRVLSLVSLYTLHAEDMAKSTQVWRRQTEPTLLSSVDIACPLQYSWLESELCRVLLPRPHRRGCR